MRLQNDMFQAWSFDTADVPQGIDIEPHPGFYARVLDRIDAQRPSSIWTLFSESLFGRRLATASLALALITAASIVGQESYSQDTDAQAAVELDPLYPSAGIQQAVMNTSSNNGTMLMSLVSYRGQ
jgi:hypothetical protein